MERLAPAEHGSKGLNGHPNNVVERLLGLEGDTTGLGMKPHARRSIVRTEPFSGQASPESAGGPELGCLLEQVVMTGEEERQSRSKAVDWEPGCYRNGYGGVRLEDLVFVTEDGCERLTDFPYELAPA